MGQEIYSQPGCGSSATISRQTVANEVLTRAQNLADRALNLKDRVYGKLEPVMSPSYPKDCAEKMLKPGIQEYPPLFNALRGSLEHIESALDGIEDAMSRTEI